MQQIVLGLLLLTVPACAQTGGKPASTAPVDGRRADTVVVRTEVPESSTPDPHAVRPEVETVELRLGSTAVTVATHHVAGPDAGIQLNALNLHDDESTSVDAALSVIADLGGRVVELRHSGDRNLRFSLGSRSYEVDPNRIFTDAGRRKTLASLSSNTPEARTAVATFAEAVLDAYTAARPSVVVTLHNNTENNYGTRDYLRGGQYANEASAATLHEGTDPDDFFFVTDQAIYEALVDQGFNAVLQDNEAATDDGSLSVWAAQHGVPYVNVEAQHGHTTEQARMLRALISILNN